MAVKLIIATARHMPPDYALAVVLMRNDEVRQSEFGIDGIEIPDEAYAELARELMTDDGDES